MKKQTYLDEMHEQKLLHIEHNMAWLAFYGLFAAICGQLLFLGAEGVRHLLGELAVFMGICLYLIIDCFRYGIWDRHIRPEDKKTHFLLCLGFSAVFGIVMGAVVYRLCQDWRAGILAFFGFWTLLTLCCWISVSLCSKYFQKRREMLENLPEN